MQVVIPVKHLSKAKARLADVCSPEQRRTLSCLMLRDMLQTISSSTVVSAVHVVSSDTEIGQLALENNAGFIQTGADAGYSEDAMHGIASISAGEGEAITVLPADLPQLGIEDLSRLESLYSGGLLVCPAGMDGGTNALMFKPPLPFPLAFGEDSLNRYRALAAETEIPLAIEHIQGLERDMDRPEDLSWFGTRKASGETWAYIRNNGLAMP